MWLDPTYWSNYFRSIFFKQITFFCDSISERVLPTFDKIDEEAEQVTQQEYERLGHLPATNDYVDMADLAESARDAGIAYFGLMSDTRQALINISTAGLYHLFEQQLLFFHRRQVLHPSEENEIEFLNRGEFLARLGKADIHVDRLPSWAKLDELRLVANAIKHGEGKSANDLRAIRSDLFVHPFWRDDALAKTLRGTIDMPLSGQDIFVDTTDFQAYKQAVLSFWNEFGELILEKGAG